MSARRRTSRGGCSPEYQISNIYGQQIYRQRASSEGYSLEHTNQDQKDYQNFNDGENYSVSAQHKKISGTISGLRKCCHFYSGSVISCTNPAFPQNHYQSIFFEARTFLTGSVWVHSVLG